MAKKKGGANKKGKGSHKNQPLGKKYEHFTIEGESMKRDKHCPRCGAGIFLAKHKGRLYCGKCHYTEFFETQKAE